VVSRGTQVDAKVLFRTLLVMGATRFILSHNHPSGNATPSKDDIVLTNQLCEAARLLELDCLDHLIVGDGTGQIVSFAETGRIRSVSPSLFR
jgi:DNA repair protein RadC